MTNVIVRTTEDIIATLRPKQGIQCEENILYLFDPNVVVSITEATSREWLEQQSEAYLNEYIKPIMDAYEEEKERDIDAYVEEKQSTIFFDNTNFTGTTTAEQINVSGDFSADNITTNTLTVLSSATIPAPTTDNNPATKKYVDDAVAGSTGGYHPNILKYEWYEYLLDDPNWLRCDTFSWHSGDSNETNSYEKVYQHLVDDIDGKTLQTETVAGITIQFYLADDGHKICPASEEANVLALYTMSGIAWYYILDTVNQRFKLPRTKYGFTGLRDTVGKYVPESLPNITAFSQLAPGVSVGAIQPGSTTTVFKYNGTATGQNLSFDASQSSPAYQDNAPVQQRATQMYLYCYVGGFTQTSLENIAGQNMSIVNQKADTDLNNVNNNIDFVIDSQEPTAENNYTGYELYRSGKVYQYGYWNYYNSMSAGSSINTTINLPIKMQYDSNKPVNYYSFVACQYSNSNNNLGEEIRTFNLTATTFDIMVFNRNSSQSSGNGLGFSWYVYGKADLT